MYIRGKNLAIGYIVLWVIVACFSIGDMPTTPPEPHPWYLPVLVFGFLSLAALFGYLAGKEDK